MDGFQPLGLTFEQQVGIVVMVIVVLINVIAWDSHMTKRRVKALEKLLAKVGLDGVPDSPREER